VPDDTTDLPADVDPRLWFEMAGCDGLHYFVEGNPHILGRIYAYCPIKRTVTRVSKHEITASSDEAVYFVRGFLSGSEPAPPLSEEGVLVEDQAAVEQWQQAVETWRETGRWTGDRAKR
jgi:hypothetical protein